MIELWLLGAYIIGTLFGIWVGYHRGIYKATESTIDQLIAGGYIKTKGDEILKYNDNL